MKPRHPASCSSATQSVGAKPVVKLSSHAWLQVYDSTLYVAALATLLWEKVGAELQFVVNSREMDLSFADVAHNHYEALLKLADLLGSEGCLDAVDEHFDWGLPQNNRVDAWQERYFRHGNLNTNPDGPEETLADRAGEGGEKQVLAANIVNRRSFAYAQ